MTRRRWIADEFSENRAALTGAHAAHLARTLRARVGQQFEVACGDIVRRGTVASVTEGRVEFTLAEQVVIGDAIPVTLLLAIFKFDRMEWAIEKCTELNVAAIIPVVAGRTEKHLARAAEKRVERWRRIAREASEQSRRTQPPAIAHPMKLKDALKQSTVDENPGVIPSEPAPVRRTGGGSRGTCCSGFGSLNLVLAENESTVMLTDVLHAQTDLQSLAVAVGPEGGWTAEELQLFASSQWQAASLGATILRTETAAIAAIAIATAEI